MVARADRYQSFVHLIETLGEIFLAPTSRPSDGACLTLCDYLVVASSMRKLSAGCMGATEFAPEIRKRYQTNELVVESTEFGTRGSEVQILSPRPIFSST